MPPDRNSASVGRAEASDLAAVGAFLRALAERAERDPAFGRQIAALLAESGLLTTGSVKHPAPQPPPPQGEGEPESPPRAKRASASPPRAGEGPGERPVAPPPDPFALLREHGEVGLRERLDALDLAALRQIIRAHRLDPARITARWANRDRLVALIVDQVRARADHGKAFSRV
jgi:hypothetical protein